MGLRSRYIFINVVIHYKVSLLSIDKLCWDISNNIVLKVNLTLAGAWSKDNWGDHCVNVMIKDVSPNVVSDDVICSSSNSSLNREGGSSIDGASCVMRCHGIV